VYARTDVGGAYRSDPANRRWMALTDWAGRNEENLTGIESIAADPVDPNRVYIAAGQYITAGNGQILSSVDMGRTWPQHIGRPWAETSMAGRWASDGDDPNLPSTLYFASHHRPVEEHGLPRRGRPSLIFPGRRQLQRWDDCG
jgi:hypothetical protein